MAQREVSVKTESGKALVAAIPPLLPIVAGDAVLGVAYGVLMAANGFGAMWTLAMSAVAFCGSMQLAAIPLLTAPFDPLQAFLLSLFVNARHLFYGIPLLKKYQGAGYLKPFMVFALSDEAFSLNCAARIPAGVNERLYYFCTTLGLYVSWVSTTFLGGLLGKWVTINTKGLDFGLTALFIVFFLQHWEAKESRIPGLVGLGCAAVGLWWLGPDRFVLPALFGTLAILVATRRVR